MTRVETIEGGEEEGEEESAVSRLLYLAEEAAKNLKSTPLTRTRVEGIV